MRELTSNEIDLVSTTPSAVTPLALLGQCNSAASMLGMALPGIFPKAGTEFLSIDPLTIAK